MSDWLERVADKFSLRLGTHNGRVLARRRHVTVEIQGIPPHGTPDEKRAVWATLLGVRLGIDRITTTYTLELERPTPLASDKKHESPSLYGERRLWLVPEATIPIVETLCDEAVCTRAWCQGFTSIFVTAWKKEWHIFALPDFENATFDAESLYEFARYSLFNDERTQKPRPHVEISPFGKIRRYEATDGLMSSRGALMPDYDWDAAASSGCFCVPSRDVMIVGEPTVRGDERIYFEVAAQAREIWLNTDFPFAPSVFKMEDSAFHLGTAQWHGLNARPNPEIRVRRI